MAEAVPRVVIKQLKKAASALFKESYHKRNSGYLTVKYSFISAMSVKKITYN